VLLHLSNDRKTKRKVPILGISVYFLGIRWFNS
jgi:hypothetical protein